MPLDRLSAWDVVSSSLPETCFQPSLMVGVTVTVSSAVCAVVVNARTSNL